MSNNNFIADTMFVVFFIWNDGRNTRNEFVQTVDLQIVISFMVAEKRAQKKAIVLLLWQRAAEEGGDENQMPHERCDCWQQHWVCRAPDSSSLALASH